MSDHALNLTVPVKAGRLDPTVQQQGMIDSYLRSREGKTVTIKLSRPASTRSLQANKYYWGHILHEIALHTGNDTESLHAVLKDMFLPRKFIQLAGRELEVRKTTADLSPGEFNQYLERITAWSTTELGLSFDETPMRR